MKKLLVAIVIGLASAFVFAEEVQAPQSCQSEAQARTNASSEQLAQQVLCCCPVSGGGSCCKYQSACIGGFINGCFCSGHSIESEPLNSNATDGVVKS